MSAKAKRMPSLGSNRAAERFVETTDLSDYDLSGFKPMYFEVESSADSLNMRLPDDLAK